MQYFHFKQNKNQYTFQTAGQKYADKVFQIVSPKMCHVTQRHPLTMHDTLALECYCIFSQNKINALKENLCMTRWLLNGFLSHEMFNLLF